jgi:hypothetical protein
VRSAVRQRAQRRRLRNVLEPVVARYRGTVKRCYFRDDAVFANPEIYEFLEAEGYGHAIRLPTNSLVNP